MIYAFTQEEKDQFIKGVLTVNIFEEMAGNIDVRYRLTAIQSYLEKNIEVIDDSYQKRMENMANIANYKSTSPNSEFPGMDRLLNNSFSGKDRITQSPLMEAQQYTDDHRHIQRIFARIDLLEEGIPNAPVSYIDSPGDDRPYGLDYVINDPNPYGDSTEICIDLIPATLLGKKRIRVKVEVTEGFLKQTYNTYLTKGNPVYTFIQNFMPDDLADLEDALK